MCQAQCQARTCFGGCNHPQWGGRRVVLRLHKHPPMLPLDHSQVPPLLAVLREMHAQSSKPEAARRFFLSRMCWLLGAQAGAWAQAETINGAVRTVAVRTEGTHARSLEDVLQLPEVIPLLDEVHRGGLVRSSAPREDLLFVRLPGRGPSVHVIGFMRAAGTRFGIDAIGLMQLLVDNPWLFGRLVADEASPAVASLSPRLRQTLELLLEGATEKRIAASLSLSTHTVHDYVKELYRRFDVCSRSELLANLLGGRQVPQLSVAS
jgi:DNA-binding CsgD family transcriptional regulator